MTSLVRSVLPILLCSVVALGQAPVWLHVGSCDGHASVETAPAANENGSCSHCCHHRDAASRPVEGDDAKQSGSSSSGHDHDSHDCFLCQSLGAPTGFTTVDLTPPLAELSIDEASLLYARVDVSTHRSTAHPRGPPA
ncbi:DUF2946 family protein [Rhodopirellula halodulae]|uniref:DUF2946 family protein n=1 Tax=Rhodopirellula halodulae TaxID=2894198 RepID=UPI0034D3D95A